jgi:acetyl esterase
VVLVSSLLERLESGIVRRVVGASDARVLRWTEPRSEVDGHALDRRMQLLLRVAHIAQRSVQSMTPVAARKYVARVKRSTAEDAPEVDRVEDIAIPTRSGDRPGRVYVPSGSVGALPALVYFHGGGHTIGDLDTYNSVCRYLCAGAHCMVISVDYRLAPEHPFPAAVEDSDDAYRWVCENADALGIRSDRIGVGGDSAGGNLSAVVSFLARDRGEHLPCVQLLIYPGVGEPNHPGRAKPELQTGYILDADLLRWFSDQYVPDGNWESPLAAPLNLGSLEGLPPAIVITTPFDLLGQEGIEYAGRLREAGVPVFHQEVVDLPHDFITFTVVPRAREATEQIAAALRQRLHD